MGSGPPPLKKYHLCGIYNCTRYQISVSVMTFLSYAFLHTTRISFSRIKAPLVSENWLEAKGYSRFSDQTTMLGLLDTLFLCFYAVGLYLSGVVGDRYNLRKVLTLCMVLSGVVTAAFGLGGALKIHQLGFFAAVWAVNGLVQSLGWPANVAVMGNWFNAHERGAVVGLWSGNASFGNILGTGICALFLGARATPGRWQGAMIAAGVLCALHGVLMFAYLAPHPRDRGLPDVNDGSGGDEEEDDTDGKDDAVAGGVDKYGGVGRDGEQAGELGALPLSLGEGGAADAEPAGGGGGGGGGEGTPISFWRAWAIPGVAQYALCYAALKSVNYGLFFWAPFYLKNHFKISADRADLISMLYDVGQILGGTVAGKVTDLMGVRAPVTAGMLLVAAALLKAFEYAALGPMMALLFFTGFMMGGPANLVSGCISADLGTHKSLRGNSRALATVTGIIDGTGSIGAAIVQFTIGSLAHCRTENPRCLAHEGNTDVPLAGHGFLKNAAACAKAGGVWDAAISANEKVTVCNGWDNVFRMLIVGDVLAAFCICNLVWHDMRTWLASRRARKGGDATRALLENSGV